jgi:hypothetical protein
MVPTMGSQQRAVTRPSAARAVRLGRHSGYRDGFINQRAGAQLTPTSADREEGVRRESDRAAVTHTCMEYGVSCPQRAHTNAKQGRTEADNGHRISQKEAL